MSATWVRCGGVGLRLLLSLAFLRLDGGGRGCTWGTGVKGQGSRGRWAGDMLGAFCSRDMDISGAVKMHDFEGGIQDDGECFQSEKLSNSTALDSQSCFPMFTCSGGSLIPV